MRITKEVRNFLVVKALREAQPVWGFAVVELAVRRLRREISIPERQQVQVLQTRLDRGLFYLSLLADVQGNDVWAVVEPTKRGKLIYRGHIFSDDLDPNVEEPLRKKAFGESFNDTTHSYEAQWTSREFKLYRPFTTKENTFNREEARELHKALGSFLQGG